ncbi:MAG TPA: hypothetical protein VFE17_02055 [Candidatus Baltobacteraceae bacterium]|jgi:hypothetical protein|nr:hypothetical protein [Candidatus Baltobacteraceae bacterium]
MLPPDIALVQLINRTATAYVQNAPAYITYRETTHVSASTGRSEEINRFVQVRQADNFALMQDLPQGATRTGQAFPIIPYFDPLAGFSYSWFANLRRIDITIKRAEPGLWPMPAMNSHANVIVPYISFWAPSYTTDSTEQRLHFRVTPTPALQHGDLYPYDLVVDPQSGLPSHIELRFAGDPTSITLDYQTIEGHWIITHATYSAPQHFGPMNFVVTSDTTYEQIAFPSAAPDPRLAGTPAPAVSP